MRGNVIGFDPDSNTGAITGYDGQRYDFSAADWHAHNRAKHGDLVDFIPAGQRATQVYLIEPEYTAPSLAQFYFSPAGRISRSQYWLRYVVPVVGISIVLSAMIGISFATGSYAAGAFFQVVHSLFGLLTIWPSIAVLVKRIHDRDKSGWLVLLPAATALLLVLVVIVAVFAGSASTAGVLAGTMAVAFGGIAIWFFFEFGCLRGTIGANRFGPDPLQ